MDFSTLILAAGKGTRMKSDHAKVAHTVNGVPLVRYVIDAAKTAGSKDIVCVLGYRREEVAPLVADVRTCVQEPLIGTGHAVACAKEFLPAQGSVVILSGDTPLIRPSTIAALATRQQQEGAGAVVCTFQPENPFGYGRVVLDGQGKLERIVEQKDCTSEQAGIGVCNSGAYCFDIEALRAALERLGNDNAQREYYLTDCIELIRSQGKDVFASPCEEAFEALGVNTQEQLAEVERLLLALE